jgi:hypothetical protein
VSQIAILLLCAVLTASHLTAYHMGRNAEDGAKLDQALAYAAEIVERQGKVDALAADLEAERAKRTPKNRIITKEVIRYVELPADRRCTLDPAWRLLHDAAATGEPADAARVAAGDAEPVADAAALEVVAGNYEACREYIEQIEGWQRWWDEVSR